MSPKTPKKEPMTPPSNHDRKYATALPNINSHHFKVLFIMIHARRLPVNAKVGQPYQLSHESRTEKAPIVEVQLPHIGRNRRVKQVYLLDFRDS